MYTKLILIEGIPGSGKTTFAKRIKQVVKGINIDSQCYTEGELHPADLAWLAYLKLDEYNAMLNNFVQYKNVLIENSIIEDDMVLVAYTKLGFYRDENELMIFLQEKEIFDGKLSIEEFLDVNIKRWQSFCKKAKNNDTVYIFECAFLQNHINEIIAFNDVSIEDTIDYFKKLISTVYEFNPTLIYLNQPDIKASIKRISLERVSPDNDILDWIDHCNNYVQNSMYGKKHNLFGFEGSIEYFKHRASIEKKIVDQLDINALIVDNHNCDWDFMFNEISEFIENRL